MTYITNKYNTVNLPNEPGMIEWLQATYPKSEYRIVEIGQNTNRHTVNQVV